MYYLNTHHTAIIHDDYILDPSIMDNLIKDTWKKRNKEEYDYTGKFNPYHRFIQEITSEFLNLHGFQHNKDKWYMDVIRYKLENEIKGVKSGLIWHCENDVAIYRNVVSVLMYLRIDDGVKEGNLRYIDKNNNKLILKVNNGMTVIMDGNVYHKPQDPYGSGVRDLIIMSFEKNI
jgi:hypothetical protein